MLEQSAEQTRNELNFWNGKVSTLRRDFEFQERHLARYKEEGSRLVNDNDYLKVRAENLDREVNLLRRQVTGLQEDNERINRMYQIVERDAVFTTTHRHQENINSSNQSVDDNRATLRVGGASVGQSKWKIVDDDNYVSSNGGALDSAKKRDVY